MNQMVPIRAQEPVSIHDDLVAKYKARQARYAAVALPPAPKKKTPEQLYGDWLLAEELRWREQERRRIEAERAEIQSRVEIELRHNHYPPVGLIISVVARSYGVTPLDIVSQRRTRGGSKSANVITPRQVVMYLARETTTRSLPEIGRLIGGRDHTTVLYGVRKITAMIGIDESLRAKVEELRAAVTGQVGG